MQPGRSRPAGKPATGRRVSCLKSVAKSSVTATKSSHLAGSDEPRGYADMYRPCSRIRRPAIRRISAPRWDVWRNPRQQSAENL